LPSEVTAITTRIPSGGSRTSAVPSIVIYAWAIVGLSSGMLRCPPPPLANPREPDDWASSGEQVNEIRTAAITKRLCNMVFSWVT